MAESEDNDNPLRRIVLKSKVVQATRDFSNLPPHSKLSLFDLVQPAMRTNVTYLYDYNVSYDDLEAAVVMVLNRYPEISGCLIDGGTVALNNQGAKIQQLTDALLTIEDLEKCQFDYETLCNHFNQDEAAPDEFLFKVTVQRLAEDSGMMLNFGFHHQVTDINSAYLVISDFCSWVREAKMTFTESDIIQLKRTDYCFPSGKPPKYEHPEITIYESKEDLDIRVKRTYEDLVGCPTQNVYAFLDAESLKQMKLEVYESASEQEKTKSENDRTFPSTNDCLLAVIHKAYSEAAHENPLDELEQLFPIHLNVNVRARRTPKVPTTYLGNFIVPIAVNLTKREISSTSNFSIACEIRKRINMLTEDYIQSFIDMVATNEVTQFACFCDPTTMRNTNWNLRGFDWYQNGDLGSGKPLKLCRLTQVIDRLCVMIPAYKTGDIDLVMSLKETQMKRMLKHSNIIRYITGQK